MKVLQAKRSWYCWVIAFACLLLSAASVGMLSYFNALFLSPVCTSLQVKRSALVLHSTFSTITTMITLPFLGKLYQRYPMRPLILIGAIFGGAAHLCYSLASSVYTFYLGGVLAGLAACLFGSVPITLLLSNWFIEKRGLVTGIAFAGSGIASSILSPVVSDLIQTIGWRGSYRFISAAILLTALLALLMIRATPESMGLASYGSRNNADKSPADTGFPQKETLKLPAYWFFALSIFLLGFVIMGTQSQLIAYWQSAGVDPDLAVRMYSIVMLTGVAGKLLIGHLYDHLRSAAASIVCNAVAICAFIALLLCTQGDWVWIPAVLFGLTTAMQVILPAYLTQKLFGTRDYVSNVGLITTCLYLGVSAGTPSGALFFDLTGSYRPAWILFCLLTALALACLLAADRLSAQAFQRKLHVQRKP